MMDAKMVAWFEIALADRTLSRMVREMVAEGQSQVEIYDCFDQFRALLREMEREADEDQIIDTMDCIVGWCSPESKLFAHYLTNEEITAYQQKRSTAAEG